MTGDKSIDNLPRALKGIRERGKGMIQERKERKNILFPLPDPYNSISCVIERMMMQLSTDKKIQNRVKKLERELRIGQGQI